MSDRPAEGQRGMNDERAADSSESPAPERAHPPSTPLLPKSRHAWLWTAVAALVAVIAFLWRCA